MFSIGLHSWYALAPDLSTESQWYLWANQTSTIASGVLPQTPHVPMMQARRMSDACRLACEVSLSLLEKTPAIGAAVFVSQHGELIRSDKIICNIIEQQAVSPTDFSMSVHNTAAGLSTILGKKNIPVSSIAAGADGFQQGLFEVQTFFAQGINTVLLVDFDGEIPLFYQSETQNNHPAYASAFVFTPPSDESNYLVQTIESEEKQNPCLPQSLRFLNAVLTGKTSFVLPGNSGSWLWTKQ